MARIQSIYSRLNPRPALSGPRASFELKRGRADSPQQYTLSEVALVVEEKDADLWEWQSAVFLYSEAFERFVGQELQMGIGTHRPAMITVAKRMAATEYDIIAMYLDFSSPRLLWREENPTWLGVRRGPSQAQEG